MTTQTQAVLFNAVPLLILAALYLAVAAALVPVFRSQRRWRDVNLALAATFPAAGLLAGLVGVLSLVEREPLGGHLWLSLAGIVAASLPAILFLASWSDRGRALATAERARDAEERSSLRTQELEAVTRLSQAIARTDDVETIGRLVLGEVIALMRVDVAAIGIVAEGGRFARGFLGRDGNKDLPWITNLRVDLEHEPSAIGGAVYEGAPVAVYDADTSLLVNREFAERVGAKSALYVPMLGVEGVPAVIVLATRQTRTFSPEELELVQGVAAEAGIALERAFAAAALAGALERERLISRISLRVRSEHDLDAVARIAVEEVGSALNASRCFVRLGEPGGRMSILAEWDAPGVGPIDDASQFPVMNLAARERRTVAVGDVRTAPELADPALGDVQELIDRSTLAVLAAPIVVFDRVIGVLGIHRPEPTEWNGEAVALAEAIAREAGVAIHTARLLRENERRLNEQAALFAAAQTLTSELSFESVMERLVEEVRRLLNADAADCWIFDEDRRELVCRAVIGLPESEVGRSIPPEGTVGEAIETRRPVLRRNFAETEQPPPSANYARFAEAMDAPISFMGETRGVLGVCALESGRFDEADLQLLEAFARLASIALRNAEAFEDSTRQTRVQLGFTRIASVLGEPLSGAATLDAVAQAAADALGGDCAAVLKPVGDNLETAGAHHLPAALERALARGARAASRALGSAAGEGKLLASHDLSTDGRFEEPWRSAVAAAGFHSLLAVPLQEPRSDHSGLILVFFAEERSFDDEQIELARRLAAAAGGALERSELYELERRSRTLAQQLARTGRELARELDPAAVLDELVRQAPDLLGAEGASVRSLEGDELVVTAASGDGAGDAVGLRAPSTAWLVGDIVQSRMARAVPDVRTDERIRETDPMLEAGYCAYLGVPLVDPDGSVHGVLAVYARQPREWRDEEIDALVALAGTAAAARSNAELYQRVALEKERSLAILANVADGIVAVDREGKVVLWNLAAEHITGVPQREALGRTPAQAVGRALEADDGASGRSRLVSIRRGPDEVWLSLSEAIMTDPAGAVSGRIFAFRDISDERVVEQMKSSFVTTVSHELRTPLTSIYGFAETLLRSDVLFGEEERRTFLLYIASESERLTAIVDRLLSVAELDTGGVSVQLRETDVGEVVAEVVRSVEESLGDDSHDFVLSIPDEPLAAEADREKLEHILSHLLDNAVRYSPEGGKVTVAASRDGDMVQVRVEDEGIGIPRGEQERIFRKFYRGEGAGGMTGTGSTGLGLFIAEGLVTAMGGRMWVDSAEGRGSKFVFELPAAANGA